MPKSLTKRSNLLSSFPIFACGYARSALFALCLVLASCGKANAPWSVDKVYEYSVDPAEAESYSYELGNASCTTGKHSYGTLKEVCSALLDNKMNNNCVEDQRVELYDSACPANS